jgi:regulator of protease activity HflC (stomatin/prohibitin superfamily)
MKEIHLKKLLIKIGLLAAVALLTTGCYEQVPPGTKGKISGKSGFQPEIYPPSKIWLSTTFTTVPEKLYLVQTTTKKYSQPVTVKLNEEKLDVKVEIVFRGRINGNDKILNAIFNDIPMNDNIVTVDEVYNIYGKQIVNNTARDIISKYTVDTLPKNYGRITAELYHAVLAKLKGLPIEISDVTIGKVSYPAVVEKAIEIATQKRMAIAEEDAKVQIKLRKLKGKEEAGKAEYRIKMVEAKRIRDFNEITSKGITKDLIKLRELELREKELEKWDGKLPTTLMGSSNVPVIVNTGK